MKLHNNFTIFIDNEYKDLFSTSKGGYYLKQFTIMVIDDEEQMRKMLRTFLEKDGYKIIEATDGAHALSLLKKETPHLLLVDVMMPFMDGFTFAKQVKLEYSIPFVFLTAKGDEWDTVRGLKLGGDDYIVKPFKSRELLARIESVLRRVYGKQTKPDILEIGPITINNESYQVKLNNEPISLTKKEYGLLLTLAENNGRVLTREQLLHIVWGEEHQSSERTIDTHIKTLRLKMGPYENLIETVWGFGYKFEV